MISRPLAGRGTEMWHQSAAWLGALARWLAGDSLLGPAWRFSAAIIVVAGPWLVSVLALALISTTMTPAMGKAAVEDLRLTVVYAFCIAPLAAGPIGAVAARRISIMVDTGCHARIPELFIAAAAFSGLAAQIATLVTCWLLGIQPLGLATGFVFLTTAAALLWTSFAVLAAVRANGFLIAAFSGGMAFSIACTLFSASRAPTTEMLVWCFTAGMLLCVALCLRHVQRLFPSSYADFVATARGLVADLRGNAVLAAGVFFAICGVWIDKWVFWFGPDGIRSAAGLLHYGPYDSVMFLAHLSIIPSYAALLLFHQGSLTDAIERFRATLGARATYGLLRSRVGDLMGVVRREVLTIIFIQGAITLGLVLMAPLMARMLDLNFNQFLMLRVGFIGVFLHSTVILCCAILIVANRSRHFMLVHGGFMAINLVASIFLYIVIGVSAYAFIIGSLIAAAAAFYGAYRALYFYDYLVFLGENESLYQQ